MSDAVTRQLGALAAELRARGARVGMAEVLAGHRALAVVDPVSREDVRLALRAAMCAGRADLERFERAFRAVFGDAARGGGEDTALQELGVVERAALPRAGMPSGSAAARAPDEELVPVPAAWSEVELLREKDFAHYTEAEVALARQLIRRLARRGPMRRSRRLRPARRRGPVPDLRRTVRESLRTGGEPLRRGWREPGLRQRPVVLVCDVSGSMAPYARMLLQYMQACVAARRRVEAFAFGTRLTRVTAELSGRDHDRALARAIEAVVDFAGGTRIGAALGELNRTHGRRLGRGSVVVILSDGWDLGDPEELSAEMARLRRSAHRLVWCNPLSAHAGYEPLTRGMRAALPHADELIAGNSLASLEQLAVILEEA